MRFQLRRFVDLVGSGFIHTLSNASSGGKFPYLILCVVIASHSLGQQETQAQLEDETIIEDMVILGERVDARDPDLSMPAMITLYDTNARGASLYKRERYVEAIPYLRASAEIGFKMAQVRLGSIYWYGLGGVKQDMEKGIGWMGVAASSGASGSITRYYKSALDAVPEESIPTIERIVQEYIIRYGQGATGMDCVHEKTTNSLIREYRCKLPSFEKNVRELIRNTSGCVPYLDPNCPPY